MRLRPLLTACVALGFTVVCVGLVTIADEVRSSARLDRQRGAVEVIARDAADLLVLTQDYVMHQSPRALRQWSSVHSEMTTALKTFAEVGPEQAAEADDLLDVAGNLPPLFAGLRAALIAAEGPDFAVRRETLADQLVNETRRISEGAFDVSHQVTLRRQQQARTTRWLAATGQGLLMGVTLLLAWLLRRRVLQPLSRLGQAARAVTSGNLGARTDYRHADELGELSQSFDTMTAALQQRDAALQATHDLLRTATQDAEAANAAKSAFLANVSHEIRTPMNAVMGVSYLLGRTRLDADQQALLAKIESGSRSLLDVINEVLDLSKIEAGEMLIEHVPFDLRALVADVADLLRVQAEARGLALAVDIDARVPSWLNGDAARLRQILNNLLGNAIKFTERGQVNLRLTCEDPGLQSMVLQFVVDDTGIGMSAEVLSRLFKPFMQADTSTSRRFGGTGLGLSIVKNLVEMMGGHIDVASTSGAGSRFEVRLPFDPAQADAAAAEPIDVLIAEDDPAQAEVLAALCHRLGWRAECVASGEAMLLRARERALAGQRPDVLLVDWQLPGLDGLQAVLALRDDASGTPLPSVVMVTSHGRGALQQAPHADLADEVLDKPVDASRLFDAVHAAVARHGGDVDRVLSFGARDAARVTFLHDVRVLVVDDSPINLEVAQRILQHEGAVVTLARDGAAAVARLREAPQNYDAVLMDVQMPVLDGLRATRQIRDELGLHELPVIALTAGALLSERHRAADAGMDAFISKPFDPQALVALLRRHVERARGTRLPFVARGVRAESIASDWPEIDGIDRRDVEYRLQGDVALFARLLRRLCDEFGDLANAVPMMPGVAERDFEAARMHKLAGSAGMLGATALRITAAASERALRAPSDSAGAAMAAVGDAMRSLIDSSGLWLDTLRQRPTAPPAVEDTSVPSPEAVRQLTDLLQARDLAALQRFKMLAPALRQAWPVETFEAVQAAIERLDFKACTKLIERQAALSVGVTQNL